MNAKLDGLSQISASPSHDWCIDVAGTNTDEVRERVILNCMREEQMSGSRGMTNLVLHFKEVKKEATVTQTAVKRMRIEAKYTAENSGKWVPIIAFECRGCEITKWHPERGYQGRSVGGTLFNDIDLSDDWCEYDADNEASVGVYDLQWKLEKV
ncbi:conserved hypothetical protein [Perkinsus marinus ATCC 50983]|uniref:DUF866 domain-containing protein n=1 Tax=Perkinsus marinus (strain ATCC 50983 / TXsc) TaxID=423536 RepID=C5KNH1_PERM5|nr:conserved hypothetical protein [Perkinsus marinus ATCC 50983]EER13986.1 conserved hypothetical protein [Perkinsus marinus ATCC 50983]|eukprot:XP_002782191.1 conserved hypothetical protein [Perkinsus marinus ATCC 50983]